MLKIIFALLLISLVKVDSTSLTKINDFSKSNDDVNKFIDEADEWLTKVIPHDWLNCTKFNIYQPPKEVQQCINNTVAWMNWVSGNYTNRSECCFKWDIVDCWINNGVRINCSQYYGEMMQNALSNKSNMKNCESKNMGFGEMNCHVPDGLGPLLVWVFVISGLIIILIILICVCCFWAAIASCLACCLCC